LLKHIRYIATDNPTAAKKLRDSIKDQVQSLEQFPERYRKGRETDTRELVVHPNYIVVYRITHSIEILRVLHARQEHGKD